MGSVLVFFNLKYFYKLTQIKKHNNHEYIQNISQARILTDLKESNNAK